VSRHTASMLHYPNNDIPEGREDMKVAVDFDGVLNSYTTPWEAPHKIPDPPVPGAIEWLNSLPADWEVYVFTTRAQSVDGIMAVRRWLKRYGYWKAPWTIVTQQKLAAHVYIDDRGYRFTGDNFPTAATIKALERWGHQSAPSALQEKEGVITP